RRAQKRPPTTTSPCAEGRPAATRPANQPSKLQGRFRHTSRGHWRKGRAGSRRIERRNSMNKQWIGCAGANFRSGRAPGFKPEAVVIHIMDGTLTGTDSWFNNPQAQVSAHYGIGRGGEVHQYVDEKDTAFHAGTVLN